MSPTHEELKSLTRNMTWKNVCPNHDYLWKKSVYAAPDQHDLPMGFSGRDIKYTYLPGIVVKAYYMYVQC